MQYKRNWIDIARSIGIAISKFLQYDLLTKNSLFKEQSPSKLDKHKIVTKLEKVLEIKNDFETLDDTNVLVVGFKFLFTDEKIPKFSGASCCRIELY